MGGLGRQLRDHCISPHQLRQLASEIALQPDRHGDRDRPSPSRSVSVTVTSQSPCSFLD